MSRETCTIAEVFITLEDNNRQGWTEHPVLHRVLVLVTLMCAIVFVHTYDTGITSTRGTVLV